MKFLTLAAGVLLFTQTESARILTQTQTSTPTQSTSPTSKPIETISQTNNISANLKT